MRFVRSLVLLAVLLAAAGCVEVNNNYLEAKDFADYLRRDGIPVESVRELPPDPFRASSAVAIMVEGSEIGVYKYDRSADIQDRRIQKLAASKRTFIAGIPYPIEVSGSFMILGLDKNKRKRDILKTLKNFR